MSEIAILSVGNEYRGDDGVGKAVIDKLQSSNPLTTDVRWLECGMADLSTLMVMPEVDEVFVIDAANLRLEPGEWRRFEVSQSCQGDFELTTSQFPHGFGLAEAIELGSVLGTLPKKVVIFGVQPANSGFHKGLSAPVRNAVVEVCEEIQCELESTIHKMKSIPTGLLPNNKLNEPTVDNERM